MGVVVPDKPQKIKKINYGWYDHVHLAGRGCVKCQPGLHFGRNDNLALELVLVLPQLPTRSPQLKVS